MRLTDAKTLVAVLALALGQSWLSGCAVNPATGQTFFTGGVSESQEQRIGRENHPEILREFGGAYADADLSRYVQSLGDLLVSSSEKPNQKFTFTVLDSPIVNAFAVPGGYVYVTRGLLALANDEAELVGVLAHEIGHVTARHYAARQGKATLAAIPMLVVGAATGSSELANLVGLGGLAYLQGYSRDQEHEADLLGVRYMSRVNYDPYGMAEFLRQLQAESTLDAKIAGRPDQADQYSILSTHPRTADRIERAIREAGGKQVADPIVERDLYLSKIDGILYGDEPEQGYIRGRRFAHPTLRFEFTVPPGFHMINTPEAVVAQQGEGAAIVFDRAPQASSYDMVDYLENEWAPQQKIRLNDVERITVNGMDAATGSIRARLRSGPRDIRLVAIRYDSDAVYRFMFLTKPDLTRRLERDLEATTYSFDRLSRGEARALRPQRIAIVEVEPGDTVQSLANRMPFEDFEVERFRVLNGLAAGDRVQPGQRVKLIVE